MDTPTVSSCPACRTIDLADGVEDGKLYRSVVPRIGDERTMMRRVGDAQDRVSDGVTAFAGSMPFVYIHGVWFVVWIALNVGAAGASLVFDRFPYGLLTLLVSLEAIFLSTFILISQNRQAERSEVRSEIDFENNLRAEIWSVHVGQALGIDPEHVEDVISQTIAGYVEAGHLAKSEPT